MTTTTMTMTTTRPTARASIIAGLVVMLAALTGCGGSDDANPDTTQAPAAPSADADADAGEATGGTDADAGEGAGAIEAEAEAEGGETAGAEAEAEGAGEGDGVGDADAEQPSVASEARPVVAAVPVEIDEASLDIELHPIEVTGEVMTVNVTVRNTADPTAGRWAVGTSFADGIDDPQAGPGPLVVDARSVDGIHVVDTVNATRHLVARDDRGYCVCSSTEALWLDSGDSVVISATFAAPPADIEQVDVFVPLAGTFTEVSIQRR